MDSGSGLPVSNTDTESIAVEEQKRRIEAFKTQLLAKKQAEKERKKREALLLQAWNKHELVDDQEALALLTLMDEEGRGYITDKQLYTTLRSWGLVVNMDDVKAIIQCFGGRRVMNYSQFKELYEFYMRVYQNYSRFSEKAGIQRSDLPLILERFHLHFSQPILNHLIRLYKGREGDFTTHSEILNYQEFFLLMIAVKKLVFYFEPAHEAARDCLDAHQLHGVLRQMGIVFSIREARMFLQPPRASRVPFSADLDLEFSRFVTLVMEFREQRFRGRLEVRDTLVTPTTVPGPAELQTASRQAVSHSLPIKRSVTGKFPKDQAYKEARTKFKQTVSLCRSRGGIMWVDPDFPANINSVCPRRDTPKLAKIQNMYLAKISRWLRIKDLSRNDGKLFVTAAEPGDVLQGMLGDCWFVSAVAAIVARNGESIKDLIPFFDEWCGVYVCRFFIDGKWTYVMVDDQLPSDAENNLVFAACRHEDEFWLSILEKAYAKFHGCYYRLTSGVTSHAMIDLTGDVSETLDITSTEKIWESLVKNRRQRFLMACTYNDPYLGYEEETKLGILANHAYTVLDVRELQGNRLLRLRNPWGDTEWRGRWSDGSEEWSPAILQLLGHKFTENGTFFMCFEDWVQNFNKLYVLRYPGQDKRGVPGHRYDFTGEWRGHNAGGCLNVPSWHQNPQYKIETKEATKLFISLRQADQRRFTPLDRAPEQVYPTIGFFIMKQQSNDNYKQIKCGNSDLVFFTTYLKTREITKEFKLEANTQYILVPSTYRSRIETSYCLTMFSRKEIQVTELTQHDPNVDSEKLKETFDLIEIYYTCDRCDNEIFDIRWHCEICTDFDLCNACHDTATVFPRQPHEHGHEMTWHRALPKTAEEIAGPEEADQKGNKKQLERSEVLGEEERSC